MLRDLTLRAVKPWRALSGAPATGVAVGFFVETRIPNLTDIASGFPGFRLNVVFVGNGRGDYKLDALARRFVGLTEAGIAHYEDGRRLVEKFWTDNSQVHIISYELAASHFEACVSCAHRAVRVMRKLRSRPDVPECLKAHLPRRIAFIEQEAADMLQAARDAIHHMEERVLDGRIARNTPFLLLPEGSDMQEGDDIRRIYDKLRIGDDLIEFTALAGWLRETATCSRALSSYRVRPPP